MNYLGIPILMDVSCCCAQMSSTVRNGTPRCKGCGEPFKTCDDFPPHDHMASPDLSDIKE